MIRRFYSELLVIIGGILVVFIRGYYIIRVVSMNVYMKMKGGRSFIVVGILWLVMIIY